jgi:uncharacterized SAM-binding protein YcdF (DUF218 family)
MVFFLSKLLWVFTTPGNLLVLLLLVGGFLAMSQRENWQSLGRKMCFDIAFLLFFIAMFPVGSWLLLPLENRFSATYPDHVDGIIIIGGDEKPEISEKRGMPVALDSARRYITFAALAREYPKAKLVFSGGSGSLTVHPKMEDSQVAVDALQSIGVPVGRMVVEDKSRNTRENAVFAADVVRPTPQQNWLLVTSAWHMPRAMACFRKVGWNVYPVPTGYMTNGDLSSHFQFNLTEHLSEVTIAVHEYIGLAAYKMMGFTDELWPH